MASSFGLTLICRIAFFSSGVNCLISLLKNNNHLLDISLGHQRGTTISEELRKALYQAPIEKKLTKKHHQEIQALKKENAQLLASKQEKERQTSISQQLRQDVSKKEKTIALLNEQILTLNNKQQSLSEQLANERSQKEALEKSSQEKSLDIEVVNKIKADLAVKKENIAELNEQLEQNKDLIDTLRNQIDLLNVDIQKLNKNIKKYSKESESLQSKQALYLSLAKEKDNVIASQKDNIVTLKQHKDALEEMLNEEKRNIAQLNEQRAKMSYPSPAQSTEKSEALQQKILALENALQQKQSEIGGLENQIDTLQKGLNEIHTVAARFQEVFAEAEIAIGNITKLDESYTRSREKLVALASDKLTPVTKVAELLKITLAKQKAIKEKQKAYFDNVSAQQLISARNNYAGGNMSMAIHHHYPSHNSTSNSLEPPSQNP